MMIMIMIAGDVAVVIAIIIVGIGCYTCDMVAVVSMTVGYSSIHTIYKCKMFKEREKKRTKKFSSIKMGRNMIDKYYVLLLLLSSYATN